MNVTTSNFITNVKTRAAIPTSQNTFTSAKILNYADEEIRTGILPLVKKVRESFYSYDVDTALNSTGTYSVPTRAVGAGLQDVVLIDSQGNRISVDLITEDEVIAQDISPTNSPAFYFKGNKLQLVPRVPPGFVTLRQSFLIRPSTLVETSAAAQITGIDRNTNTLTFGSLPSTFTTSSALDFIKANPHFECSAIDQTPASVTTTTLVFSSLPSDLAIGDWVALAGESPIVQIPFEFYAILEQRVANRCLQAQGQMEGYKAGEALLRKMEDDALLLITPRVQREPKKIVGRNGFT
jgi:hypothetical protein